MPIFDQNDREVVRILDNQGREIETVYDQNGVIVYTNAAEMTGNTPLYFKGRGKPLTDYRISGETVQNGKPSPDMPVDVVGCGERMENLINASIPGKYRVELEPGKIYCLSKYTGSGQGGMPSAYVYDENGNVLFGDYINNWVSYSFKCPNGGKYAIISFDVNAKDAVSFVEAPSIISTFAVYPQTYIPYGYKLPVTTTNGTDTVTTPVYIGSEPLHRIGEYADYVDYASGKIVRKIKKLVLTGEENCTRSASFTSPDAYCYAFSYAAIGMTDIVYNDVNMALIPYPQYVCSHFKMKPSPSLTQDDDFRNIRDGEIGANTIKRAETGGAITYNRYLILCSSQYVTVDDFKSYLAAQYATGVPVTVWYILETPIEEDPPVPLPALPILAGINTMSLDTTVKPSQMYIKGKIKPDGYGNLTDRNGVYILDKNGVQLTVHGQGTSN